MMLKFHRRRLSAALLLLGLLGLIGVSHVARTHARAMTEFVDSGTRTLRPEELGLWQKLQVLATGVTVPKPQNLQNPTHFGLEYHSVSYPNSLGDTLSAWLIDQPTPTAAIVLFHGYADSKQSLIPMAEALQDIPLSFVLVDFYGSGDSSGQDTRLGEREAADVVASLEFAKTRWPGLPVVLYGVSMGGAAVLRAIAHEDAQPQAIILESVFDTLLNAATRRFEAMQLPPRPLADLLLFWGGRHWGFDTFGHNPVEYAVHVECPALVIAGDADVRVDLSQTEAIHSSLTNADKLVIIQNMTHESAVLADRRRWRAEVRAFLEKAL